MKLRKSFVTLCEKGFLFYSLCPDFILNRAAVLFLLVSQTFAIILIYFDCHQYVEPIKENW